MSLLTKYHRYAFSRIYKNFVDGEFVQPKDSNRYHVRNPVTQEELGRTPQTSQEEFDHIVAKAK